MTGPEPALLAPPGGHDSGIPFMVLITGVSGLLGANLAITARDDGMPVAGLSRAYGVNIPGVEVLRVDLTDTSAVERLCRALRPRWVVHCAALTNVDWCEDHPAEAQEVNAGASGRLAAAARSLGARVVYVSTDAVFDGKLTAGYKEEDTPAPLNVYARTKWLGEKAVLEAAPDSLVVRTNLYGWNVQPKQSLAEWVLSRLEAGVEVPGFDDVVFSPLLANDLGRLILDLMGRGAKGVYHAGAADSCSKYAFAHRLAGEFGFDSAQVLRTSLAATPLRAPRPFNTVLNTRKLSETIGRVPPTVAEGLRRLKSLRDCGFVDRLKKMA